MPATTETVHHASIKVKGQALPPAILAKLLLIETESTYNRQDSLTLAFDIDANEEIPPALELGAEIEVAFKSPTSQSPVKAFHGEITALQYDASEDRSGFVVEAEDKFHRLFRGDRTRTFLKQSVTDAVKKVIAESGVPAGTIDATTAKLPFQMQQNVSDGVFLLERAAELGFHTRVIDGRVFFGKVGAGGESGVVLEQGNQLLNFSCRVTATTFVKEVTVRSWDVVQKKEIISKADQYAGDKDAKVANAFAGTPKVLLTRSDLGSPDETKASAQAALDRANELQRQAEGRCYGDARIAVDKTVEIKGVNKRFNGKYRISQVRHRYSADEGFTTEFASRGVADQSLRALVSESAATSVAPDRSVFDGVTVGIVTDNKDPDGLGRVQVKIPALTDQDSTGWLRMALPGAGGTGGIHGWYLLPEVNDEVLVAFEQGDVRRGYVIGGLLNGKEKPAYPNDKALGSGNVVNQHAFRMKGGAHLLFDENSDEEKIEVKNKDGCFTFSYSSKNGVEIKHSAKGEKFTINNKGDVKITSTDKNITIEAPMGALTLKAQKDITIESQSGKVAIKAAQDASVDGLNVKVNAQASAEVKGNATAKLEASGQTTVKGAMVMIN